jgi:hypothetical protein
MWILSYLPDSVTHTIFVIGVLGTIVGFVLGFIPLVNRYKLPIQIISILILSFGLYLEGGLADQAIWQLKVKEMEAKVAKAETESQKVTTEVVTKILTKKQVIKEKGNDIVKYIDREVVKYNNTCTIPEVVITAHNAAAKNETTNLKTQIEVPTDLHNKLAIPPIILAPIK